MGRWFGMVLWIVEGRLEQPGKALGFLLCLCLVYYSLSSLTYGHGLWVTTKRTKSWIQAAEMMFFQIVAMLKGKELRLPERAQGRAAAPW